MTTKKTIILTVILFSFLALSYPACSKKSEVDNVSTSPNNGEPTEATGVNEDDGWSVGDKAVVNVLDINFRTKPSADSPRVSERPAIYYGMLLEVIGVEGEWINVRLVSGETGWAITKYEGDEYIRKAYDGDLGNITSDEFLDEHRFRIEDFAADNEIYKVYCALFHLNGADWRWKVIFTADSRPGEMLYLHSDKGEVIDINTEGLLWLPIEPYTGPNNLISSEDVCEYKNISAFLASERVASNIEGIRDGIKSYSISLHLALSGKTWQLIFVEDPEENPTIGITGHFDPTTGEFLFADGKMSWE